jgi:multidrug resistance efflux pump
MLGKIPFLTLLALAFIFSCKEKKTQIQVKKQKISHWVYASGVTASEGQYQITSDVSGKILEIFVKEGETIKKGATLLSLDPAVAKLQAENALEQSKLNSQEGIQLRINDLQANLESAQSKFINDSIQFNRQKNLWNDGIGSKVELEQRELAFVTSKRNFKSVQLKLADLRNQLDFQKKQSKINASIARINLSNFFVKSMVDGLVYDLLKEPGEFITPSTPLAIVGNPNKVLAKMQVDEEDFTKIKLGQKVALRFESLKDSVLEASISKIIPYINPKTRTFEIEAQLSGNSYKLIPNLSFEANILIEEKPNALTIPLEYLLSDTTVLNENGEPIKIKIGLKDYKVAEVIEGLKENTTLTKP